MFGVRQLIVSYLLALACAGPAPLWLHHWLEHSCGGGTANSRLSTGCHDCVFCKHQARLEPADDADLDLPTQVRSANDCEDCWVCYQLSQSTEKPAEAPAPAAAELVGVVCLAIYDSPVMHVVGLLGPRGPPSVIEAC